MAFLIIIFALFFTVNMGGTTFAASFAAPFGSRIIEKTMAALLFVIFVVLGAYLLGENVAITLGREIVSPRILDERALLVILFSAGISLFVSNLMRIPQSTSFVTVAAIAGVGAYHGQLEGRIFCYLVPFWVLLPVASYFLAHVLIGMVYPPRKSNFWVYERFINHQDKLKFFVVATSCYCAFAVGSNNVANVAGPMMGITGQMSLTRLLAGFAIVYGGGAFLFTEPIKTAGHKIVPLGLLSASIISVVAGSLMLFASTLGIPQSFVMLKMAAIFAVASIKEGHQLTFQKPLTKQTLYTWTINPVITFFVSWGLYAALAAWE